MQLSHLCVRVNLIRPEPSGGEKFIMLDPKSSSDASYVEKRHRVEIRLTNHLARILQSSPNFRDTNLKIWLMRNL